MIEFIVCVPRLITTFAQENKNDVVQWMFSTVCEMQFATIAIPIGY